VGPKEDGLMFKDPKEKFRGFRARTKNNLGVCRAL